MTVRSVIALGMKSSALTESFLQNFLDFAWLGIYFLGVFHFDLMRQMQISFFRKSR